MKKKHTHYRSFFNPATGGQLHPHRLLPLVLFIPLVILVLTGFPSTAEAASEKSPSLSAPPPGVQVYEQADVNCANPQYPPQPFPSPRSESGEAGSSAKPFTSAPAAPTSIWTSSPGSWGTGAPRR